MDTTPFKLSVQRYESWMRAELGDELVEADLDRKHEQMRSGPFPFLRATFWRWCELVPSICNGIALDKVPHALAVGDSVRKHGPVRALVAPNAYHYLGLSAWKARFPDAQVFAPAQSVARVEKRSKVADIRPVGEMAELLGDRVEVVDMPHYKTGEALVRWRIDDG